MTPNEFYTLVGYLANPARETNIEVEMPERRQHSFIKEYAAWTNGYPLPANSNTAPYYVWLGDVNKYGLEIRVYFISNDHMPLTLESMLEPRKYQNRPGYENWERRISTKDYVIPFFEAGFILGNTQNVARIRALVPTQYMPDFNNGYAL